MSVLPKKGWFRLIACDFIPARYSYMNDKSARPVSNPFWFRTTLSFRTAIILRGIIWNHVRCYNSHLFTQKNLWLHLKTTWTYNQKFLTSLGWEVKVWIVISFKKLCFCASVFFPILCDITLLTFICLMQYGGVQQILAFIIFLCHFSIKGEKLL